MTLTIQLARLGRVATLRLHGRVDRDAAELLEGAFADAASAAPEAVELDFADVDYINSTGIALIVGLLARARADRIAVRALGLTDHYRHIFEITRLCDFIEIVQPATAP
ncbi:STAS domain-containing protein [Agrococcus terreus]|uniref:STAS domain-containing protein n=1 Tax=Agrococcus terreus TaxID=574649 RepID=UPI00384D3BC0